MDDGALASLAKDIKLTKGPEQPIVLFEGKVLDGRNRLRVCARENIELSPKHFVEFRPNGLNSRGFVFTQNLHRRQLTIDQRAALAAELVPMYREAAKLRVGGRPKKNQKPSADLHLLSGESETGKSSELAARFVGGVSVRYVEQVLLFEKKVPGTLKRIKDGELTIAQAQREIDALYKNPKPLAARYGAPMVSVLDAQAGYWMEEKQWWRALGVQGGHDKQENGGQAKLKPGFGPTSAFDPVLAHNIYDWFAPKRGHVLDPFAGEATKGAVAAYLGYHYTGIDVSEKQVQRNYEAFGNFVQKFRKRYPGKEIRLRPNWVHGDSAKMETVVPETALYDLVFTSPPYYDLEIYSKKKRDISASGTYEQFMAEYELIFAQAVARLKQNSFLVVKVGNMLDAKGFYRNFVGDNITYFTRRLGLHFYNDAVLATSKGSAGQRCAARFPKYRQLEGTHQNVLCFFKGDNPRVIPQRLGILKERRPNAK